MTELGSAPRFVLVVDAPDTAGNFTCFNADVEQIDSEHLMEPVNEADYDSETQVCVDTNNNGPRSFYEHFATKRKKKKTRQSCNTLAPTVRVKARPSPLPLPSRGDFLCAPTAAMPHGCFSNPAVRRLATGRMPPPLLDTGTSSCRSNAWPPSSSCGSSPPLYEYAATSKHEPDFGMAFPTASQTEDCASGRNQLNEPPSSRVESGA